MKVDLGGFIEKAAPLRALSVVVSKDGERIGEYHWDEKCRRNIYSATKSFTSAAVGIALKEGLLSLEEKLTEAFSEDLPGQISENLEKASVRDLLTMCLGQGKPALMGGERPYYTEKDWVKFSLALPFEYEPGTKFLYNNVGPYLAGILVQRRAGCDLAAYLKPRLFDPLGILGSMWERDPMGNIFGAGGLCLCIDELHKFGLLYLQDGNWNGKQLISKEWVRESTRKQVENETPYGYGYLFWGDRHGVFRADGKYSQLSMIMREKNAVVSIMAECRDSEALREAIFDEIYPQL